MVNRYLWITAVSCSLILLVCTFIFWPVLGHDYSLIIPSLIDLKVAFSQHEVLNPEFSPMKCLGTPLWANPVSFNLSLLHLLTIISNDLIGLGLFIAIVGISSFYGAYRLARFLNVSDSWALYLATGWTLQGWMIVRTVVGHTTYISLGWFPLILYLLLKKRTYYRDLLASLFASVLISQFVFLAAPYTPFFLAGSFLALIPILYIWKEREIIEWKSLTWKVAFTAVLTFNILYPKLSAVRDLMSAYPRSQSMLKVGLPVVPYSIMNLFSFLPHDYKYLVEWWYGNWESTQFIFPLLLLSALGLLLRRKEEKTVVRLLSTIVYLIGVSVLFCSGVLADIFQTIPFINSMHVNPRWNIITALPVFFLAAFLLKGENLFSRKWMIGFFTLALLAPFLHLRPGNLNINYTYREGYVPELNRLSYCYEPFLGYGLEYFPQQQGTVDFRTSPSIDPRCYLPTRECSPGTLLPEEDRTLLESYKLQ